MTLSFSFVLLSVSLLKSGVSMIYLNILRSQDCVLKTDQKKRKKNKRTKNELKCEVSKDGCVWSIFTIQIQFFDHSSMRLPNLVCATQHKTPWWRNQTKRRCVFYISCFFRFFCFYKIVESLIIFSNRVHNYLLQRTIW